MAEKCPWVKVDAQCEVSRETQGGNPMHTATGGLAFSYPCKYPRRYPVILIYLESKLRISCTFECADTKTIIFVRRGIVSMASPPILGSLSLKTFLLSGKRICSQTGIKAQCCLFITVKSWPIATCHLASVSLCLKMDSW